MAGKTMVERLRASPWVSLRLECVSAGARWVWQELVNAMSDPAAPEALSMGSDIGFLALVSRIARVTETEAETHVTELLARDLLVQVGDTVSLPPVQMVQTRRAVAARINGLRGGRPRKDGTPRQQPSLMLAIDGGALKNPTETQADGSVSLNSTKIQSSNSNESGTVDGWIAVAEAACEAAGLDPAKGFHQHGIVKNWMQAGATREVILAVVGKPQAKPVWSLNWFDRAVRQAIDSARAADSGPKVPPHLAPLWKQFEKDREEWRIGIRGGALPKWPEYVAKFDTAAA